MLLGISCLFYNKTTSHSDFYCYCIPYIGDPATINNERSQRRSCPFTTILPEPTTHIVPHC